MTHREPKSLYFIDNNGERLPAATGNPEAAGFGNTRVLKVANGVLTLVRAYEAYAMPTHTQDEELRGYLDELENN